MNISRSVSYRLRIGLVAGVCAVLLGHGHPVSWAQLVPIAQSTTRPPEVVTGELFSSSPVLEGNGSYYEAHTFDGTAGEVVTIELSSEAFDAYLILLSPTGEPIAQNDNGAEGTNSRITLILPATGTYTLIVSSYGAGETGTYRLEMRAATVTEQPLAQAVQINQQASELYQAGRYAEAIPLAEQALAIIEGALGPEHPDTSTSLSDLAVLYYAQGRYEEAELLYQRALAIREAALGPEHPATAGSLNNLAALYRSQGRYSKAEPLFQRALAIREAALGPKHPATANSLNNLATLYEVQGRYGEAETLFQRALTITEGALGPNHPDTAVRLNNLAALYEVQGRYGEAEPLFQRALAITEGALGPNHPDTVTSLSRLAGLYKVQGRYREAKPLLERALAIREAVLGPEHPATASSLNNLALLYYAQGLYGEAEPLLERALAIREAALGPEHPATAASLNNLAFAYVFQGLYGEAEPLLERALAVTEAALGPNHPETAGSLNNLAALYRFQGRYGEAEPLFQRVLAVTEAALGMDHPDTARSLSNLAGLYYAQGQLQLALSYLSRGLTVEEGVLSRNLVGGSDANKRDYLATVSGTTDVVISLHLNDLPSDTTAAQLALTTVLQRKGRILDLFTNLRAQLTDDSEALALLDELNVANTQLTNLAYSSPAELAPETRQAQLNELQTHLRRLEDQLSRRSNDFADLTASPTVAEIQSTLLADTALVEFMRYRPFNPTGSAQEKFGAPRYAAYVLIPDGTIQGIDVGPAEEIETAVSAFAQSLSRNNNGRPSVAPFEVIEKAQAMDAMVMAPVRERLGAITTVFLSPDGALNRIPFEALVDASGDYLVEHYQFRYLTSGRDLMRLDNTAASANPALLIGNPTYGRPGALVATTRSSEFNFGERIFPALEGTEIEVEHIASQLEGAQVYIGPNATEAVVKEQDSPSILHIATHGFFEPATEALNPLLQSGLVLAGAAAGGQSGPDQDGLLSALEVTGLDLSGTQLAVLSACQTGLGVQAAGEGLYGLRRALVLAGAQSQVISLWKVNDSVTQQLMVEYYNRLLDGVPRDQALRDTQRAFLESEDYSHPYYWAAFIGSGDWRPLQLVQ